MSNWEDIFNFNDQLTEEERLIQSSTNEYCQKSLMPRILEANRSESFDKEIYKELGSLGLLGAPIDGYGCAGTNYVTYGFIGKITECKTDEQFLETETLVPMKHEKMPGLLTVNSPIKISDEPKKQPYRAPILGEHTQEILKGLGFDENKITKLKETGAIEY